MLPTHSFIPSEARATERISTPNGDDSVGGIGLVFKAGPIGSGPLVKGIVPGGSADVAGGARSWPRPPSFQLATTLKTPNPRGIVPELPIGRDNGRDGKMGE